MNSGKKIKGTLAKTLSEKVSKKLGQKTERVVTTRSSIFNDIKNTEKTSSKTTESKKILKLKKITELDTAKSESANNDDFKNTLKSRKSKHCTVKQETERGEELRTSLENINIKSSSEQTCNSKEIEIELSAEEWKPTNWQLMLENIRNMRSNDEAPVDTMGCHKCADESADEKTQRFHKLVALMLSSQTKDETTYHAMLRLREHTLTPEVICNTKLNVLENILHPVSFYKNKAKYLQKTSEILVERYNSDIPNNIKELVALPGVGPKMAHICMSTAWQEVTGIGVDVHVHRISNRMGWLPKPTKEPEQTRRALEAWLPQHLWAEVNHLLVGFGQTTCTPVKPKCNICLNCHICPSAVKTVKKEKIKYNCKILDLNDEVNLKKSKIHV